MYNLIGLGNPGEKYENTRHNAGAIVLSGVLENEHLPKPMKSAKFGGMLSEGVIGGVEARLFFSDTYMNQSGHAVKKLLNDSDAEHLVVIYDDIDIPLGTIRVSYGKNSGGHKGLESIIEVLGSKDFIRLRVGIAPLNAEGESVRPDGEKLDKYVLGRLTGRELEEVKSVVPKASLALRSILTEGYEVAMNKFN